MSKKNKKAKQQNDNTDAINETPTQTETPHTDAPDGEQTIAEHDNPKTSKAEKEKTNCLYCGKLRTTTRGLCNAHYNIVRTLVKTGQTTWEVLEQNGKASKPKKDKGKLVQWALEGDSQ